MPRPPGSENPTTSESALLAVIATVGVNALAAVYPAAGIPATVASAVQDILSLLPQKSDLDPQGLTRQIGEALQQMGLQKNALEWAVNRASEILQRYGSEPVNRVRAGAKDARPEAAWMAQRALDAAKGSDLDPGDGEENQHTLQVLRIYYDVYLHHENGFAEIAADVLDQLRARIHDLEKEPRIFPSELIAKAELRKAERNCYVPGGQPPPELSLRSITAKYGVVSFYNTTIFDKIYSKVKNIHKPMLLVIEGPGGSGKTRLALELGRRLKDDGWRLCFVALSAGDGDFQAFLGSNSQKLFAVADYALRMKDRVEGLVIDAAREEWHDKPFCLVLIDRKVPGYVEGLINPTDSAPNGVKKKITFEVSSYTMPELSADEARMLFEISVSELANTYALSQVPDIKKSWSNIRAFWNPLSVTLGALLAVNGSLTRPMKEQDLLAEALNFEINDRWIVQGEAEGIIPGAIDYDQREEYENALKLLAVYVILRGHVKESELKEAAASLLTSAGLSFMKGKGLEGLLCRRLPYAGQKGICAALEPDPVADYLIEHIYKKNPNMLNSVIMRIYQDAIEKGNSSIVEKMLETIWRALPMLEYLEGTNSLSSLGGVVICSNVLSEYRKQLDNRNNNNEIMQYNNIFKCNCNTVESEYPLVCLVSMLLNRRYIGKNTREVIDACNKKMRLLLDSMALKYINNDNIKTNINTALTDFSKLRNEYSSEHKEIDKISPSFGQNQTDEESGGSRHG